MPFIPPFCSVCRECIMCVWVCVCTVDCRHVNEIAQNTICEWPIRIFCRGSTQTHATWVEFIYTKDCSKCTQWVTVRINVSTDFGVWSIVSNMSQSLVTIVRNSVVARVSCSTWHTLSWILITIMNNIDTNYVFHSSNVYLIHILFYSCCRCDYTAAPIDHAQYFVEKKKTFIRFCIWIRSE